jgi:magnesium chelatase subunit I
MEAPVRRNFVGERRIHVSTGETQGLNAMTMKALCLGELRNTPWTQENVSRRTIKQEMRENLLQKLESRESVFQGIHGYEETVIPQIFNAILARQNFILLGLRGQAKSRILRSLIELLDAEIPVISGCEINDNPYRPICKHCREIVRARGDETPIAWLPRDLRFVEKLATPDVTIADILGDVDPIKAARGGRDLSDELTIHYGLLPRANRGIFAINELPDLAGKIQVGLFNIMQEGDIQIKGYPIRLPLDVLLVFTANPEDYTARGKIVTPLKDRIGAEIRTHYPATLQEGMTITAQEAWLARDGHRRITVPDYLREVIEEIAFQAREEKKIDRRSGVSQRLPITVLENVASSAEQRAAHNGESHSVARVADLYASIPSMTGKFELEYEGEMRGADNLARDLIRTAVGRVYSKHFSEPGVQAAMQKVVQWFELGGEMKLPESAPAAEALPQLKKIQGLLDHIGKLGVAGQAELPAVVAAAEFVLEGLWAHRRISRNEERGFHAEPRKAAEPRESSGKPPRRQFN